jgi:hypothetical protein
MIINQDSESEIQPIEWKQYVGETVNTNLIIRGGKKYQETAYYEDKVKNVPRGNAYIIGNGPSRKGFNLNSLKATGQTYGCNALYRDFMPDFIFSVDGKMTATMVEDKVYEKCIHYSPALEVNRYPHKNIGNSYLHLVPNNPHWISGNQAFWTAAVHGHKNIYLLGFDFREFGKDQLNNIYQDTKNYGPRHNDVIFEAWLTQFRQIQKMRPYCNWTVVHDDPPDYLKVSNPSANFGKFKILNYKEFTDTVLDCAV